MFKGVGRDIILDLLEESVLQSNALNLEGNVIMTNLIIRLFIQNNVDIDNVQVHQRYGVVSGTVGILCNILLFFIKLLAGIFTSSVSIMADAFNNLSDAGSSIMTLIGFKIAVIPADDEHPFGHGRFEYISGFVVSMVIILMGFELMKTSIEKIVHPIEINFQIVSLAIMIFSIGLKLWMCFFYKKMGRIIGSSTLEAAAKDSLSDVVATLAVVVGILIYYIKGWNIDGYMGCAVAIFILYTGISTAKETINPLLGQAPDPDFVKEIEAKVLSYEDISGVHDLIVHNYGPQKKLISLHAEVPCNIDIMEIHDIIDTIEREITVKFHCEAVIHIDPIVTDDEKTLMLREKAEQIVSAIDQTLTIHDFRTVRNPEQTRMIFDVSVPYKFGKTNEELIKTIGTEIQTLEDNCKAVIHIDRSF